MDMVGRSARAGGVVCVMSLRVVDWMEGLRDRRNSSGRAIGTVKREQKSILEEAGGTKVATLS